MFVRTKSHCFEHIIISYSVDNDVTIILLTLEGYLTDDSLLLNIPCSYKESLLPS